MSEPAKLDMHPPISLESAAIIRWADVMLKRCHVMHEHNLATIGMVEQVKIAAQHSLNIQARRATTAPVRTSTSNVPMFHAHTVHR